MCSMIVCVLIPRFELTMAVGDRSELLRAPVALSPEPGGTQQVGEVSLAAEAFGIHPRMRLGEALSRCPELTLVPPDPAGVADSWGGRPPAVRTCRGSRGLPPASPTRGSDCWCAWSRSARRSSPSARGLPAL